MSLPQHIEEWCDHYEVDIVTLPDIAQDSFIAVGRGDCAVGLTPEEAAEKLAASLEIPAPVDPATIAKPEPEPSPAGFEVELVAGPFCGLVIHWPGNAIGGTVDLRGAGIGAPDGVHVYRLEDSRETALYVGLKGGAK